MLNHLFTSEESSQIISGCSQLRQIRERIGLLTRRYGLHTRNYLLAAGFHYTGDCDAARCDECGLEVRNWSVDMVPFKIHSERRPHCPFVRSMGTSPRLSTTAALRVSMLNEQENTTEHHDIESNHSPTSFVESELLQQVRRRTCSHWPHPTTPSAAQIIEAGFFGCNVDDRVICIYCNLICERWTPHGDRPDEVHRALSPNCMFVKALLRCHRFPIIINGDGSSMAPTATRPSFASNNINSLQISSLVRREIRVDEPFNAQSPSIDDCIQRTYFNTNKKTIVNCPSCLGAFRDLDSAEDLIVEHARWFPHCAYAREVCGEELYRRIHGSNSAEQALVQQGNATNVMPFMENGQLVRLDENTISRLVAARLDLPISQTLLNRGYSLRIVRKCWEDQLRLKREDFVTNCDFKVACLILRKQEQYIHGRRGVIIPDESMQQWTDSEAAIQAEIIAGIRATTRLTSPPAETNDTCVVCLIEKKMLVFLPCGHLATCVPCGYSLSSCPLCRRKREAFFRINI